MTRVLLLIIALFGASPSMALAGYTQLFVFGDSLSDNGNAYEISGFWPPSPPYAQRFSNGPVAVEYLAGALGVPLAPSALGGTGYAVGGATTGTQNYSFEIGDPAGLPAALQNSGMLSQLSSFAAAPPSFDPATSLFMVWGGPNDFFLANAQGGDLVGAVGTAVSNIATIIGTLASFGATDFLVPNMADLGQTPFALSQPPEVRAALSALSDGFNAALAQALDALADGLLIDMMTLDVAGLFDAVIANPEAFGFTNTTERCVASADPGSVPACEGFLFFDEVHPTTAAHRLVGAALLAQVTQVPEPPVLALLAGALLAAGFARRRISR